MNARVQELVEAFRILVTELAQTGAFTLEEFEDAARFQFVRAHLEQYKHNQSRAARALVIHRNTMRRLILAMKKAGMDPGRRQPRRSTAAGQSAGKQSA